MPISKKKKTSTAPTQDAELLEEMNEALDAMDEVVQLFLRHHRKMMRELQETFDQLRVKRLRGK